MKKLERLHVVYINSEKIVNQIIPYWFDNTNL